MPEPGHQVKVLDFNSDEGQKKLMEAGEAILDVLRDKTDNPYEGIFVLWHLMEFLKEEYGVVKFETVPMPEGKEPVPSQGNA